MSDREEPAGAEPESFEEFLRRREAASNDYIRGDAAGLADLLTGDNPATFLPPNGKVVVGAQAATEAQVQGASGFGPDSTGHFEILNSGSGDTLAFWAGLQRATMQIKGQDDLVPMVLRTTEVFRLEGGRWKLIHRHADMTAEAG